LQIATRAGERDLKCCIRPRWREPRSLRPAAPYRRVGNHDVDLAMIPFNLVRQIAERADIANVRARALAVTAKAPDLAHRLVKLFRIDGVCVRGRVHRSRDIDGNDIGVIRSKLNRDRAANPARGA
jgi:hypothetical protein